MLTRNLYLGGAYRLDRFFGVQDVDLNLSATPPVVTSNYAYSIAQGFDPNQYTVSGVAASALFDSRDSTINPYRGFYANLSFAWNPTWLGSSQGSTVKGASGRTCQRRCSSTSSLAGKLAGGGAPAASAAGSSASSSR